MNPVTRPYDGIRILDLTYWLGTYATRLFADLGAEVIRVEPPEGLPDRQQAKADKNSLDFAFEFLNASKQSIVIDPATQAGRDLFLQWASTAQIIMIERGAPFYDDAAAIRAASPASVITLVSPFGASGPLADAPATDLTLQAAGGIAWMSGRLGEPPLALPFGQSTFLASVYAAVSSAIALYDAEASGHGHVIDVSAQECIAHSLQNAVQVYDLEGRISMRGGEGTRDASEDMFVCKDGYVFLAAPPMLTAVWAAIVAWMAESNHPSAVELANDRWKDRRWRTTLEARQRFRDTFESFSRGFTRSEIRAEAVKRRLVLAPVNRVLDVLQDDQLAFTQFFQTMPLHGLANPAIFPGPPYRMSEDVWSIAPAPRLGEHASTLQQP